MDNKKRLLAIISLALCSITPSIADAQSPPPYSWYAGSSGLVCACEELPVFIYYSTGGPRGFWLYANGTHSYTFSQTVYGNYEVPIGKCVSFDWYLVYTPTPTTPGYYQFGNQLRQFNVTITDCP
ncbi:MAG TPA: hypothetical protein PKY51_04925 [Fimbriimonadaceae bacterium]|nr:hypothetical protein [Fimbriimonadaceae bacterium]